MIPVGMNTDNLITTIYTEDAKGNATLYRESGVTE